MRTRASPSLPSPASGGGIAAGRRGVLKGAGAVIAAAALPRFAIAQAKPEIGELVIAPQFGLSYVPLHVVRAERLLEKHLARSGLPNAKVNWAQTTGGATANDALLSGTMHVVGGGIGPMLTIWDKTRGNLGVRGICSCNSIDSYLNTTNPAVKSIADFTERDRIAVTAVKTSIQAVNLQMACEKLYGEGRHTALDHLTVSLSHPDATAALLSGKSEVTANWGAPPFQYQQLDRAGIHKVTSTFEVLGGPASFNGLYTTARFREDNPRAYGAVFAALVEAQDFIQKKPADAIAIYIEAERSKLAPAFIAQMMASPDIRFTVTPENTIKYAEFMHKTGTLKNKAASYRDYYFPEVHGTEGS